MDWKSSLRTTLRTRGTCDKGRGSASGKRGAVNLFQPGEQDEDGGQPLKRAWTHVTPNLLTPPPL